MSATQLDPKTALIVVDLQRGVVGLPTVHPIKNIIDNTVKLLEAFRIHNLPVVLVRVTGAPSGRTEKSRGPLADRPSDWADLIGELNQQPTDHVVTKQTRGAFMNTDLHDYLQEEGVTQVVIVGVSTGSGVESTARQAHEHGYNVMLAIDAMSDLDEDIHINSVKRIFPGLGETGTTDEIVALLDERKA